MTAFIALPIECEDGNDILVTPGLAIRRRRFPREFSYRAWRVTYGPDFVATIDTQADVIRTAFGAATETKLAIPDVGTITGRWSNIRLRVDSPTAAYLDATFTEAPRYA